MSELRSLPSVDFLLQTEQGADLIIAYGRPLTVEAIRSALAQVRSEHLEGKAIPLHAEIFRIAGEYLEQWLTSTLVPVINASGVVLHTNLGRAPLSRAALQTIQSLSAGYCTLEFDLNTGRRGSRSVHAEALLTRLTGAQAAFVVNNNAAAVLLTLSALARGKRVIISRSQLVEIGGGFRVPDVMRQSGAKLLEVGTTNRVHLADYEEALEESVGLVLHTHHSNFRIIGFVTEPSLAELSEAAHQAGVPLMDDLGSGALLDTARFGLGHEPTIQESLSAGADLVCFSGDKLLGGPQAGIIVGKSELITRIKKHPLARAVRADKLCLAALSATLTHYLKGEAEREIPIWQMIALSPEKIQSRCQHWAAVLQTGEVVDGFSTVGGGSLPEETLPTYLLAMKVPQPNHALSLLRASQPPIIARIEKDRVVLDPRTVLPGQDDALLAGLKKLIGADR